MMDSEAFVVWANLFDENIASAFRCEHKELKKIAMLVCGLKNEFRRVENLVDEQFNEMKQKILSVTAGKSALFQNLPDKTECSFESQTVIDVKRHRPCSSSESHSLVDLCTPEDCIENEIPCSLNLLNPTSKNNEQKKGITVLSANSSLAKNSKRAPKKKKTVLFSEKYSPLLEVPVTANSTEQSNKQDQSPNKKQKQNCFQLKKALCGFKSTPKPKEYPHMTRSVPGKVKKELPGWTCKECNKFYDAMELTPEAKKMHLNNCSKHRNERKPAPDTPEGVWDLQMPPSPESEDTSAL